MSLSRLKFTRLSDYCRKAENKQWSMNSFCSVRSLSEFVVDDRADRRVNDRSDGRDISNRGVSGTKDGDGNPGGTSRSTVFSE